MDDEDPKVIRLVDLGQTSFEDIATQMETMARMIRSGEVSTSAGVAVFLGDDGVPVVCGWGRDTDSIRGIGLLTLGAQWLCANQVKR